VNEVLVDIDMGDLSPLRRYLAMNEMRMVEVAVAFLLEHPRDIREWIANGDTAGVTARKAPARYQPIDPMAAERAATEADHDAATGCRVSRLGTNHEGYATVHWSDPGGFGYRTRRRTVPAARAAFTHYFGPVPDGYRVFQACGNRRCVAEGHLSLRGMRRT